MRSPWKVILIQLICPLLLVTAAAASSLAGGAARGDAGSEPRALLNGSFVQLLDQQGGWSRDQWERLFANLQSLGLRQIVIQWTLYDNRAFYDSTRFERVQQPPLEVMLQLAQARHIELYIGLATDSNYWEMVKLPPARREGYLDNLRWKSEQVAREVAPVAVRYSSFKGWYLPEEIDDLNWRAPAAQALLRRHLERLSSFLKGLTPEATVMLSGFSDAALDPDSFRELWQNLLTGSSVDGLLFQDCVGTGKIPSDLLPFYLQAARQAADSSHKKLQVVVELFTEVAASPFKAVPAPFSRVKRQLREAAEYATGGINSFSVPDYMSPDGGPEASALLRDYLDYKAGDRSPEK